MPGVTGSSPVSSTIYDRSTILAILSERRQLCPVLYSILEGHSQSPYEPIEIHMAWQCSAGRRRDPLSWGRGVGTALLTAGSTARRALPGGSRRSRIYNDAGAVWLDPRSYAARCSSANLLGVVNTPQSSAHSAHGHLTTGASKTSSTLRTSPKRTADCRARQRRHSVPNVFRVSITASPAAEPESA